MADKKKSKSGRSKAEITAAGKKQTKKVYKKEMAKEAEMAGRIKRHVSLLYKEQGESFDKLDAKFTRLARKYTPHPTGLDHWNTEADARARTKRAAGGRNTKLSDRTPTESVKAKKDFRGGTSSKRRYGNKK